jgi:hypothetical protein
MERERVGLMQEISQKRDFQLLIGWSSRIERRMVRVFSESGVEGSD